MLLTASVCGQQKSALKRQCVCSGPHIPSAMRGLILALTLALVGKYTLTFLVGGL